MSTFLPDQVATAPVSRDDLLAYFHAGGKPEPDWRVGAEFEAFVVDRASGRTVSYDEPGGIRDLLQALADRFGWQPHDEGGRLTALTRCGAAVSLEPGGQVEFSSPPVRHVGELADEYRRFLAEVHDALDPSRFAVLAAGVTPLARVADIPPPVRPRHTVMADYLPARCQTALEMMKATASTQAAFDYSGEADAVRKFAVALTLGPVVNALWGNSPLAAGRPTGWASHRGRVWLGMDPDRSGVLPRLLAGGVSFAAWVDYLLDVPLLFTVRDGAYRPGGGHTFRQFLEHGLDGRFPTLADWEVHLTTVFPEARLKRFLEVRGADANGPALALAVPALWKGLLYDGDALAAAEAVARRFPPAELPRVFEQAARHGLAAEWQGRPMREWAAEVVGIAGEGLRRQALRTGGADERPYLAPVLAILERGASPGSDALAAFARATPTVADVLARYSCLPA
jgi:glutamate--cysteine ligase